MLNSCKSCYKLVKTPIQCAKCEAVYHFNCVSSSLSVYIHYEGKLRVYCCPDTSKEPQIKIEGHAVWVDGVAIKGEIIDEPYIDYIPEIPNKPKKKEPEPDFTNFLLKLNHNPENNTKNVYAIKSLDNEQVFGPYEGIKIVEGDHSYAIGSNTGQLIDVECEQDYCWIRYINCTDDIEDANLEAIQYGAMIYYKCTKTIHCGEELLVLCREKSKVQYSVPILGNESNSLNGCIRCLLNFSNVNKIKMSKDDLMEAEESSNLVLESLPKPWKCHLCNYSALFRSVLMSHFLIHTKIKKGFYCKFCKLRFVNNEHYQGHFESSKNNEPCVHANKQKESKILWGCYLCTYSAMQKTNLLKHVNSHNEWQCRPCKLEFPNEYLYKKHMVKCQQKKELKNYSCQKCDFSTSKKYRLSAHCRQHEHSPFKCSICKVRFLNQPNGRIHFEKCKNMEISEINDIIESNEENRFKWGCHLCDFRSLYKYSVTNHFCGSLEENVINSN